MKKFLGVLMTLAMLFSVVSSIPFYKVIAQEVPDVAVPPETAPLTVTKIVDNTGGGTKQVADFPLFVDGNSVTSGEATTTNVGPHVVSETPDPNYTAVFSGNCDQNGNVIVTSTGANCTITNTFQAPAPAEDVTVTIVKYVDGEHANADNANSTSFSMTSTWNDPGGIGSGTGSFNLDTGDNYQAVTSEMHSGADYSVVENDTPTSCDANAFSLTGYKIGDSEQDALASGTVQSAELDNITSDKYILVMNHDCSAPPPPPNIPPCDITPSTPALTTFDDFSLGTVNGQFNWSATGPYDQAVVDNTYGYLTFGCKSLRVSDAVTSGSFGDWIFAAPLDNSVGETDATNGGFPEGTRQNHFEVQFDIASTLPGSQQPGLHVSVSPDRGDGSRMSYLRFEDGANGMDIFFDDVTSSGTPGSDDFRETQIATGIDRTVPHTVKLAFDAVDGPSNDVVKVYIDGSLVHTGTSWEDYYRYDSEASAEQSPRIVKTIIIQARGTAHAADQGNGFLFDNLSMSSGPSVPPPCVVDDSQTLVSGSSTQENGHDSVAVTPHPAWTTIAGATWIYGEALNDQGSSPIGTEVFTKTFNLSGTPLDSSLEIATDNYYSVSVNGHLLDTGTSATDLDNFSSSDSWTVPAADLVSGANTIQFTVTNPGTDPDTGLPFGDPNPGGLLFKLVAHNNGCFVKVHIYKYLDNGETTTQVPDDSTLLPFPMHSNWQAANLDGGNPAEADYILGNNWGGATLRYAADTSPMQIPVTTYSTYERTAPTDPSTSQVLPIGAPCQEGKFRLVGYKYQPVDSSGDSLAAAQSASISPTPPTYSAFSEDKYVIVVNEACPDSEPNPATLTIVKHSIGGDGSFYFQVTATSTEPQNDDQNQNVNLHTEDGYATSSDIVLDAGTYDVLEGTTPGWDFTDVSCEYEGQDEGIFNPAGGEEITVDDGDHVTCTFTNTKQTSDNGTLEVTKVLINGDDSPCYDMDNDGVVTNDDVNFVKNNIGFENPGFNDGDVTGNGSVNSSDVAATKSQLGRVCSPGGFSFSVNGGASTPFEEDGTNDISEAPGQYSVTETENPNYTTTYDNCDPAEVSSNGTSICTITNTFNPGSPTGATLTIVKQTEGGEGTFNFQLHGENSTSTEITTESGSGTKELDINTGTSSVAEDFASGWNLDEVSCVDDDQQINGFHGEGEWVFHVENGDHTTCTFTNTKQTSDGGGTPHHGGGGSSGGIPPPTGSVLGASTDTSDCKPGDFYSTTTGAACPFSTTCPAYLESYLRLGYVNPVDQVIKLQTFLNEFQNSGLPINGFFGQSTDAAVKAFQSSQEIHIRAPWEYAGVPIPDVEWPTGYVYKTTKWWINTLKCPDGNFPLPPLP